MSHPATHTQALSNTDTPKHTVSQNFSTHHVQKTLCHTFTHQTLHKHIHSHTCIHTHNHTHTQAHTHARSCILCTCAHKNGSSPHPLQEADWRRCRRPCPWLPVSSSVPAAADGNPAFSPGPQTCLILIYLQRDKELLSFLLVFQSGLLSRT